MINHQLITNRTVPTRVPTGEPAKKRGKVEDHIQHAVAMVLDELGLLWFHPPNELGGMITVGHLGQLISQGLKKGVSDCIILDRPPRRRGARFVAIELKAPGGRPSPEQSDFILRARALGGVGEVVEGLANALALIAELGWDVAGAIERLRGQGYVIEGERMVRVANRGSRARKSPARG